MNWILFCGIIGAICTTFAYLPQVIKTVKTKQTRDLSLTMIITLIIGIIFWLIYGILDWDWPLVIANTITLVFGIIILIYKYKYK